MGWGVRGGSGHDLREGTLGQATAAVPRSEQEPLLGVALAGV